MDELLSGMEGMLSPHYCVCRGGGGGGGRSTNSHLFLAIWTSYNVHGQTLKETSKNKCP